MHIVHFGHSCVLVDTGSARLLFDPGVFSAGFETLTDLDGILITHQHSDHLDTEKLPALLAANPNATLVVDQGSTDSVTRHELSAEVVRSGDNLELGGAVVTVVGGQHAVIHPDIPVIPNVGYVVDHGVFYHPGDSLAVPEQKIDVLGVPTSAPWLKISEAIDFLRAVTPRAAVPIHQGTVAELGEPIFYNWFAKLGPKGTTFTVLPRGEATVV